MLGLDSPRDHLLHLGADRQVLQDQGQGLLGTQVLAHHCSPLLRVRQVSIVADSALGSALLVCLRRLGDFFQGDPRSDESLETALRLN